MENNLPSRRSLLRDIGLSFGVGLLGGCIGAGSILFAVAHPDIRVRAPWVARLFPSPVVTQQMVSVPTASSSTGTIAATPNTPPPAPHVQQTEDIIVNTIQRAKPAVVSITITKSVSRLGSAEKQVVGGGSGFFVSADGIIVTNKHVVADTGAEYHVVTQDGKKFPARILALDPSFDIAIIKIDITKAPYLELGDSDALSVGQTVIAIGNALAEFQNSVTKGVISGLNRKIVAGNASFGSEVIEGAIQTDAAINHGNSGGPLLNIRGQVIGVNTAISEQGQSLGFALPINTVKRDLASVKKTGKISRAWMGVRYVELTEDIAKKNGITHTQGALIVRGEGPTDLAVAPGSPADKAGIVENDIILSVNGQVIDATRSLVGILSRLTVGDRVQLRVVHQGEEKTVTLTLIERPTSL